MTKKRFFNSLLTGSLPRQRYRLDLQPLSRGGDVNEKYVGRFLLPWGACVIIQKTPRKSPYFASQVNTEGFDYLARQNVRTHTFP
jgi:hypothetical protein